MVASNVQLIENKYTAHYAEFSSRYPSFQAKADPNLQIYSEPIYNEYLRQQQAGILKSQSHLHEISIDPIKLHNKLYFDSKELHKQNMDEKKIAPDMPQNQQNIQKNKIELDLNRNIQMSPQISAQKPITISNQVKIEEIQYSSKHNDIPEISHTQPDKIL